MSRMEGVIQIRDLKFQNLAMGVKLLWNLIEIKPAWSSHVIWRKYFSGPRLRCLDSNPENKHGTPIFSFCRKVLPKFRDNLHWIPGNAKKIRLGRIQLWGNLFHHCFQGSKDGPKGQESKRYGISLTSTLNLHSDGMDGTFQNVWQKLKEKKNSLSISYQGQCRWKEGRGIIMVGEAARDDTPLSKDIMYTRPFLVHPSTHKSGKSCGKQSRCQKLTFSVGRWCMGRF